MTDQPTMYNVLTHGSQHDDPFVALPTADLAEATGAYLRALAEGSGDPDGYAICELQSSTASGAWTTLRTARARNDGWFWFRWEDEEIAVHLDRDDVASPFATIRLEPSDCPEGSHDAFVERCEIFSAAYGLLVEKLISESSMLELKLGAVEC